MNAKRFKELHMKFLGNVDDPSRSWFQKIITERHRDRWFLRVLPPLKGLDVLDLCGGYGMFGAYLKSVRELSFNYTCLDKDKLRIDLGPEYFKTFNLKPQRFILHNISNPLPTPPNRFDMVWLFGWCSSFFNCIKLFREVSRVLKPKGRFIFNMARAGGYKTKYSRKGLLELLKKTNFNVLKLDKIPNGVDFGVVAIKSNN
ncbi:hypothetical protein ES702_07750 [subsurface metagenome]